jgi:hypothetical protein
MYACPEGGGAASRSVAEAAAVAVGAPVEESSALAVAVSKPAALVSAVMAASVPGRGLFMRLQAYNARPPHVAVDRPMAVRILGWP